MKRRLYAGVFLGIIMLSFALFVPFIASTRAADGDAGSIAVNIDFIVAGAPITVRAYDLTVGADYLVNHTNDATGYSFTAPADGMWQLTIPNIARPTSGSQVTFHLRAQTAGTSLASVAITVFNLQDFLVTGLIVVMGIFLFMVVLIRRVASKN